MISRPTATVLPACMVACFFFLVDPLPTNSADPSRTDFSHDLQEVIIRTGEAYLAGEPLTESVPESELKKLGGKIAAESPERQPQLKSNLEEFERLRRQAINIQEGRDSRDELPVYLAAVASTAEKLKVSKEQPLKIYGGRIRSAQRSPAGMNGLSPEHDAKLMGRAENYAKQLNGPKQPDAAGDFRAAFPGGAGSLAKADYRRFNAMPGAPRIRLDGREVPGVLQRQEAAMAEGESLIREASGAVCQSRDYWIQQSRNRNGNPLWRGYAYFNRGLLRISGLMEVEESAARTGWAAGNSDVSGRRVAWEGTKLTVNSALFAANFVGISGSGQVISRFRALDKPAVVRGLEPLGVDAAERVAARAKSVGEAVNKALGPASVRDFKAAAQALDEYARVELGGAFRVQQGGRWGEAVFQSAGKAGEAGVIRYSPRIGRAHEFAHAGEMFVNRAAAMEIIASKTGKDVARLSAAEVDQAMQLAGRFERAYYAQHEAQALRSSGFFGLLPGSDYGAKLAANNAELVAAWSGKPRWSFTFGQRLYGALSGLGQSPPAIAGTLSASANAPGVREGYWSLVDEAARRESR